MGPKQQVLKAVEELPDDANGASEAGAHMSRICGGASRLGESRDEAVALIREAIDFHVDGLRQDGAPVPSPSSESELVEVGVA